MNFHPNEAPPPDIKAMVHIFLVAEENGQVKPIAGSVMAAGRLRLEGYEFEPMNITGARVFWQDEPVGWVIRDAERVGIIKDIDTKTEDASELLLEVARILMDKPNVMVS